MSTFSKPTNGIDRGTAMALTDLPSIAANTLLGNNTGGSTTPIALTVSQVQAMLGGGTGTVTSVALTVPAFLSVTGSPVTSSGTLAVGLSGTALPQANGGTGVTTPVTTPTAAAFAAWDTNKNLSANSHITGYTTTATAAGTTTLTVASTQLQYFTGSITQTVVMPVTSTLVLGQQFVIVNNSTGVVTVQSSGANTIQAMAANTILVLTVILTSGTTAASWNPQYSAKGTIPLALGGTNVTAVTIAPTATSFAGWDANKNLSANAFIDGYTTTATAAGTTTMTIASAQQQYWTGTTTQTVKLPTTSVVAGMTYTIVNLSTGVVTVQSSGANTILAQAANSVATYTALSATPTTAAAWSYTYASVLNSSLPGGSGANTSLSNLASTALNVDLLAGVTGTISLGNTSFRYLNAYISSLLDSSGLSIASLDNRQLFANNGSTVAINWATPGTLNFNSNVITGFGTPTPTSDQGASLGSGSLRFLSIFATTLNDSIGGSVLNISNRTLIANDGSTVGVNWATPGTVSFNSAGIVFTSGNITTGGWQGTAVTPAFGGTGLTSLTTGSVVVGNGTSSVSLVAPGTSGNILTSNGSTWVSSAAPSSGGFSMQSKSASFTAVAGQFLVCTGSSTIIATLPTAVGAGGQTIVINNNTTNFTTVQIRPQSGEAIGNLGVGNFFDMHTNGEILTLVSDNTIWQIQNHVSNTTRLQYTPTFVGFGTVTTSNIFWWRDGTDMFISGTFIVGTPTATANSISLPGSQQITSTSAALELVGDAVRSGGTSVTYFRSTVLGSQAASTISLGIETSTVSASTISNGNVVSATGDTVYIKARVTISDWQP